MAKVAFTKLGLTKNTEVAKIYYNGQEIEVKQYLPIQEKMDLITSVLNQCQDENNFINDVKVTLYFQLELVFRYTNLTFTEKQKEDASKLYDLLSSSGVLTQIKESIPEDEYADLWHWTYDIVEHIYEYKNSIYGILDALNTDYKNLEFDAESLKNKIADPDSLALLKSVLTKLG